MAQAFIESGTSAGNRLMLPFDKAAEELTSKFDPFVEKQTQQLSQEMTAIGASLNWATSMIWAALLAALGISATVAFVIGRGITRPLGQTVKVLTAVATGDLTLHLEDSSQDEVGQMTQALNHAVTHMGEAVSTIAESASLLARASEELATTSRQITGSAETTAIESNVVSEIAVQVKEHVVAVTTAAEEMCACINRIAQRVNGTAEIVTQAVQEAESARAVIGKLEDSSKAIGQVVKVITAIAEQTNLLALNATIEAARAGEAGKGFAVVANEVKELAKQTAEATSGIGQQVVTIQADTHQAITAIGQIATVIGQINEMSMSISSAVEEQKATTDTIGRNVGQAYKGSAEIAELLSQKVVRSIRETVSNVQVVQQTSGELAHMATELQQLVSQFRYEGTGTASHTGATPERGEPTTVNGHAPGYTHEAGEVRI
jgi:methyl-accepting chemotaxis protein